MSEPNRCHYCGRYSHSRVIGYSKDDDGNEKPIIEAMWRPSFSFETYGTNRIVHELDLCKCSPEVKNTVYHHLKTYHKGMVSDSGTLEENHPPPISAKKENTSSDQTQQRLWQLLCVVLGMGWIYYFVSLLTNL